MDGFDWNHADLGFIQMFMIGNKCTLNKKKPVNIATAAGDHTGSQQHLEASVS